ncbi:hypothetical protein HRI_004057500 [Hibiscus trionum]|uniref:Uncharacterized protein n=1 Tax=Hibiscus trionum TaxID=183268 RepID=A0A9W7IZU4_HIBTR|nr:hypothetical protein HRI_004057500 [Hibiscus trionum]
MEKRKKHKKFTATASNQESESNDHLSKGEQNQPDETLAAKVTKNGSSLQDHSSLNDRYSNILQWPYTTQQAAEQSSLDITSPTPSILASRSQQVAPLQPNSHYHPVQQGQPAVHLAPSTSPFWPPQRPSFQFPAVTVPATFQPFTSMAAVGTDWQPSPMIGGTPPRSQHQVPNICYHFGPYPGFPGPWEPSSWWTHSQQTQPSFNYTFPGSYSCFSSEPPPPNNCSATFGESSQRGIIQTMGKLSQKHQQLWEAQSMENVQLWKTIGHLQSEIADYKGRLVKLEAEVSSLKPFVEEPFAQVVRTGLSGAASKKWRPKGQRSVGLASASASPDESHPQERGRKPAANKDQPEPRALVYENVVLNKVGKIAQSTSSSRKNNSVGLGINGSNLAMAAFHNQAQQESPGIRICGMTTNSTLEMKAADSKAAEQAKQNTGVSGMRMGGTNGESETLTLPASFGTEEPGRNIYNQSLYENGYLMREAGKLIPGWSFDVSDAVMVSAKEEEMGDDVSSGSEEIAQIKDDFAAGRNPEDI